MFFVVTSSEKLGLLKYFTFGRTRQPSPGHGRTALSTVIVITGVLCPKESESWNAIFFSAAIAHFRPRLMSGFGPPEPARHGRCQARTTLYRVRSIAAAL